MYLEIWY